MEHPQITNALRTGYPEPVKVYGIDAMGNEVMEGDEIIVIDGEFVLEENALEYLIGYLDAERKVAGEEE